MALEIAAGLDARPIPPEQKAQILAAFDNPLALVPYPDTPVDTGAVLEIAEGFNRSGGTKRLETKFSRFPV